MLSSCANPSCTRKFRYLHQGKLFLLSSKSTEKIASANVDFAGQVEQLHYAWLCDTCAATPEVVLDSENRIKVRARYNFSGLAVGVAGAIAVQWALAADIASCLCELMG